MRALLPSSTRQVNLSEAKAPVSMLIRLGRISGAGTGVCPCTTILPKPPRSAATRNTAADYERRYAESVNNPEAFWAEEAKIIDWMRPFTKVKNTCYDADNLYVHWFEDGCLNVAANCLDRHLAERSQHQVDRDTADQVGQEHRRAGSFDGLGAAVEQSGSDG